jgi:hypothetical protein
MIRITVCGVAALGLFAGSASAQELKAEEALALVKGKTIYIEVPAGPLGPGIATIYYADDGKLFAKFPKMARKGTWLAKGNTICPLWDDTPNNPCSRYVKDGDKITSFNAADGQPRGVITKTAAGNPENL